MNKIKVLLESGNYDIFFKDNENDNINKIIDKIRFDKIFIITEESIFRFHKNHEIFHKNHEIIKIKNDYNIKTILFVEKIIEKLILKGCSRNSLIIGVGGGVITDFSGFIASIIMRGVPHILIPTTLLAMVDASIGGKTGINTSIGKNLIGTYKNPEVIYLDLQFLNTLNKKEIINGFAEILKYSLICDKDLFFELTENFNDLIKIKYSNMTSIIQRCCQYKIEIVNKDEFEKDQRRILNFGHTIGHALESYFNYRNISHGQAVYYGMISASFISYKLNYLSLKNFNLINNFIRSVPLVPLKNVDSKKLYDKLEYDKKRINNKNNFILLKSIGNVIIKNDVPNHIIKESLDFILQ